MARKLCVFNQKTHTMCALASKLPRKWQTVQIVTTPVGELAQIADFILLCFYE